MTEIRKILIKHSDNKKANDEIEKEILAMKEFRESGYGDKPWNVDGINKDFTTYIKADPLPFIQQHADHVKQFQFNQQSNFLYHFVNKFTDTEVPIEAIREELRKLIK